MQRSPIEFQEELNKLCKFLLGGDNFRDKLNKTTDRIVQELGVDLCCIWLINPCDNMGDFCVKPNKTNKCSWDRCLHLISIAGESDYIKIHNEKHKRIPLNFNEIGGLATGEESKFLYQTLPAELEIYNSSTIFDHDPVSFAGYQIRPLKGETMGVLMLLSREAISSNHDKVLECLASVTGLVILAARAEEALQEERNKQFDILYDIPTLLYLIDNNNYNIKFGNKAFNEKYGIGENKKCYKHIAKRSKPCVSCSAKQVFNTGERGKSSNVVIREKESLVYTTPFYDSLSQESLVSVVHVSMDGPVIEAVKKYQNKRLEEFRVKYSLTQKECDVLIYILKGQSDKEIAGVFSISPNTVKRHTQSIFQKIDVHSRIRLMALFNPTC